jgi:hypothetical protein
MKMKMNKICMLLKVLSSFFVCGIVVNCGVDFFDSDSESFRIFFCPGLWTYKQQRFDFKDNFEDSDVENFSQLVRITDITIGCQLTGTERQIQGMY